MYVSVLGSLDEGKSGWHCKEPEKFIEACRCLGTAIVKNGHILLVDEAASKDTATWHAFAAIRKYLKSQKSPGKLCLAFIDPDTRARQEGEYRAFAKKNPGACTDIKSNLGGRKRRRLFQLIRSDAVAFLGGGRSTYQMALTAGLRDHIVYIGSFGGAANKFLSDQQRNVMGTDLANRFDELCRPWDESLKEHVLCLLGLSEQNSIMIVHGRSDEYNKVKVLLLELGVPNPIVMKDDLKHDFGKTLPEKFEDYARKAHAVIAVVTPDDVGGLVGSEIGGELQHRARQNVWLEVGWFWGRLGRHRILLLSKGKVEIPSNLMGIEEIEYREHPNEQERAIRAFIGNISKPIEVSEESSPMHVTTRGPLAINAQRRSAQV